MVQAFAKIVAFALLVNAAFACSCFFEPFETRFCNTKLSVRAEVILEYDNCPGTCDPIDDQIDGKIFYLVKVVEKFKGSSPTYLFLQTAVNGALCGTELQVGKEYFLNLGSPQSGSIFYNIGLCDFSQLWSSLTPAQMKFVRSNANGGKDCPALPLTS